MYTENTFPTFRFASNAAFPTATSTTIDPLDQLLCLALFFVVAGETRSEVAQ